MPRVQAIVRNPVLGLPSAALLQDLPADAKSALRAVLVGIRDEARVRADKCWKTHKAPMAVYWKCVAVYANHIARAIPKGTA